MIREKLAKDIAQQADIKTDLKYEQDKSDPKDDYVNARKLLMPDSLYNTITVDQAEQTRKAIKDSVSSGEKVQSETPVISYHTDPKQDYLIRATRDFAQPYLQQKYDAYTKERGLPKTKVYAKPNYEGKYDSVAAAFGPYPFSYVEHYVDENELSTIMSDAGISPLALSRADRSVLRLMDDTIGHEVAHIDPSNPYSRSFMDNFNTNLRLALGAPNQVNRNILLDEKFGESSDRGSHKNYFALPGRSLDELRSVYYGYINRLKKHPMSFTDPLPNMYYPKLISQPIINSMKGILEAKDNKTRNFQVQKGRHYLARMLYPHLGDPGQIRTDDLKDE